MLEHPVGNSLRHYLIRIWMRICLLLRFHGKSTFPNFPLPVRLSFGAWWLAWNDVIGKAVLKGQFESSEVKFISRLLRPGMTVLDIGAHHGYYTLLASVCVGHAGHVFAFEPSARERRKLGWNVRLNRCSNVDISVNALGAAEGQADLFVTTGRETGCNSLRRPDVRGKIEKLGVSVEPLDEFLSRRGIEHVDFIKLDVEGAELSVLEGAQELLSIIPRPTILVEVSDLRTASWGYAASEILEQLSNRGYYWFEPREDGSLVPATITDRQFDQNFVAVPEECLDQIQPFLFHP